MAGILFQLCNASGKNIEKKGGGLVTHHQPVL